MSPLDDQKQHLLTVSLEDYYQGAAFRNLLTPHHWSRFEDRIEQNTNRCLALLAKRHARATFFVSTWLAQRIPKVIETIVDCGHEIASAGVTQRSFRELTEHQLRDEARNSKRILEQITGRRILGYRVADHRMQEKDLWALRVLAEEGYRYDSSVSPSFTRFLGSRERGFLHSTTITGRQFYELPLPATSILGFQIPIAGGNYFRQIPELFLSRAITSWIANTTLPFVFYFRVWDLDPEQPEITGASAWTKFRHYRNSTEMPALLDRLLARYSLVGISEYLGLTTESLPREEKVCQEVATQTSQVTGADSAAIKQVSIVIPCFNETHSLPYLGKALSQLAEAAKNQLSFQFIFINDGSADGTGELLTRLFGSRTDVTIVHHSANRGITEAILTGIGAAQTDLVCSIDCDCTYDPLDLIAMIAMADDTVHCVTASPYHPDGQVKNVPQWRLGFSKFASQLYRWVLNSKLHTFTSCCRVYRRASMNQIGVDQPGFVGIAEILGRLHLAGYRIAEFPTTLAVRMLGRSKMRIARNIPPHLHLLCRLLVLRFSPRNSKEKLSPAMAVPKETTHG